MVNQIVEWITTYYKDAFVYSCLCILLIIYGSLYEMEVYPKIKQQLMTYRSEQMKDIQVRLISSYWMIKKIDKTTPGIFPVYEFETLDGKIKRSYWTNSVDSRISDVEPRFFVTKEDHKKIDVIMESLARRQALDPFLNFIIQMKSKNKLFSAKQGDDLKPFILPEIEEELTIDPKEYIVWGAVGIFFYILFVMTNSALGSAGSPPRYTSLITFSIMASVHFWSPHLKKIISHFDSSTLEYYKELRGITEQDQFWANFGRSSEVPDKSNMIEINFGYKQSPHYPIIGHLLPPEELAKNKSDNEILSFYKKHLKDALSKLDDNKLIETRNYLRSNLLQSDDLWNALSNELKKRSIE